MLVVPRFLLFTREGYDMHLPVTNDSKLACISGDVLFYFRHTVLYIIFSSKVKLSNINKKYENFETKIKLFCFKSCLVCITVFRVFQWVCHKEIWVFKDYKWLTGIRVNMDYCYSLFYCYNSSRINIKLIYQFNRSASSPSKVEVSWKITRPKQVIL